MFTINLFFLLILLSFPEAAALLPPAGAQALAASVFHIFHTQGRARVKCVSTGSGSATTILYYTVFAF